MKKILFSILMFIPLALNASVSGECGDGVSFVYDETTHILRISKTGEGTGEISNYSYDSRNYAPSPWYSYSEDISQIIIDDEITSIGDAAFIGCSNATVTTIGNSVVNIGSFAFAGCNSLTSVTIPNNVKRISDYAFRYCNSIIYATIGDHVETIGDYAFELCTSLISINIPNSVTSIGKGAFISCITLTGITIPNLVTVIETETFSGCSGLTSITIGESVATIGSSAFYGCSGLTSIIIPNSTTSIGGSAFCDCSSLTTITMGGSVTSIGNGAFSGCRSLTTINIPNSVTTIDSNAFSSCSALTSIIIPNSVTAICDFTFWGCSSLTTITIPNSLTSIGYNAFYDCQSLTSIAIPNTVTSIGAYAFANCSSITDVCLPDNLLFLEEGLYSGCSNIKNVELPKNIKIIRQKAFSGCSGLQYLTIPSSVEFIYQEAFANCLSLEKINAQPTTPPFLYDNSFSNFSVPLKVPKGCKEEYQNAQGWKNFTKISDEDKYKLTYVVDGEDYISYEIEEGETITPEPAPVKEGYTFSGWSEIPETMPDHDVTVTGSFTKNLSIGDAITAGIVTYKVMNTEPREVQLISSDKSIDSIEIPSSVKGSDGLDYLVTSVGNQAFYNSQYLKSVVLPNSITKICEEAFNCCQLLEAVSLSNKLDIIEKRAFLQCSRLTTLNIPSSVTSIGKDAFWGCSSLNIIIVEGGNKNYDSRDNCNAIIETQSNSLLKGCVNTLIPSSVTTICEGAFYNCAGLTSIAIPEGMTTIEKNAFEGCSGLTSIILPSTIASLGGGVFVNTNLTDLYLLSETPPQKDDGFFVGLQNCRINVPCGCHAAYFNAGWNNSGKLAAAPANKLIYLVDNQEYLSIEVCGGKPIIPEAEPQKEGYTFSGWSKIPEIMPEEDVTITGSFTVNKYMLIYQVDGSEYKTYEVEYGATISPETYPEKEGYTFSGWSDIPETMPAKNVTITGTFTINKYKLTYIVDGEVYKTYEIEYGANIIPEENPTKDGNTFSGWSEIPETMPAHDVEITGSFTEIVKAEHGLFIYSDEQFIPQLGFIATLGRSFTSPGLGNPNGLSPIVWTSSHPEVATVDDNGNLTIKAVGTTQIVASFAGNDYYEAGLAEYSLFVKDASYDFNDDGTVAMGGQDKTGDVTIDATITINGQTFNVTAIAEDAFKGNQNITSVTIPEGITTIGNNAFSGCVGLIVINIGKDVQTIGSRAFANIGTAAVRTRSEESMLVVNCYTENVPQTSSDAFENTPIDTGKLMVNDNLVNAYKSTYPWSEFGKIYSFNDPTGINVITIGTANAWIFDIQGNRLDHVRKGVNIIRNTEGNTKKVMVK